jgi:hypothetical protein
MDEVFNDKARGKRDDVRERMSSKAACDSDDEEVFESEEEQAADTPRNLDEESDDDTPVPETVEEFQKPPPAGGLPPPPQEANLGKEFLVTMSCNSSLNELASKRAPHAILQSANRELAKHFGTSQAPIREIAVMSYDNGSNVSLMMTADHLPGTKKNTHITDAGACMLDLHANTKQVFAEPPVVYVCEKSQFQQELADKFRNVDLTKIETEMKEIDDKHVMIKSGSVIMWGIAKQRELASKAAKANGETFSMPAPAAVGSTDLHVVEKSLAIAGINLVKEWDQKTKDRINVSDGLHFRLSRSKLSSQTMATAKSSASTSQWLDTRELKQSLKSGHTIENQLAKPFEVTVVFRLKMQ